LAIQSMAAAGGCRGYFSLLSPVSAGFSSMPTGWNSDIHGLA